MAVAAALVAVLLTCPVPVLDEESYLAIASGLDPLRPYDWWRPWPPWGGEREADAFVYAHPPGFLWWVWGWLWLMGGVPEVVGPLKVAAGLPWALLLGWSVGRLCERTTQRPWLAAAGWLTSPVVVLGLQRGLMPDLVLTSLIAYAAVAWIEGMARPPGQARTWWLGSGLALGLACLIKYPAVLLAPVLLVHAWSRRRLRDTALTWVLPLLIVGGVELWLLVAYGRPHLWEVLSRAGEIPRGAFLGRAQGVLVRLCLAGAVVAVVGRRQGMTWAVSVAVAFGLAWLAMPDGTSLSMHLAVVALASVGMVGLFVAARAVARGVPLGPDAFPHAHEAVGMMLGLWVLVWAGGVVIGHNFAGPRYLLPLSVPLALLVARFCELRVARRRWLGVVVALQGLVALGLTWSERRFSVAAMGESIDNRIARHFDNHGGEPLTLYTGPRRNFLEEVLSYRGPKDRRAAEDDPWNAYQRMIGPVDLDDLVIERQMSVNDLLLDQIDALMTSSKLSTDDRRRLELHFDSIRDFERLACRLAADEEQAMARLAGEGTLDANRITIAKMHMDLIALSFACDHSRTATLQIGDGNDGTRYTIDGELLPNFHWCSHRIATDGDVGDVIYGAEDMHHSIDRLMAQTFSYLLEKLDENGVLENAVAVWHNDLGNGVSHSYVDVPFILVGEAGGQLSTGQFLDYGGVSHHQLLTTLCQIAGVTEDDGETPLQHFGDESLEPGILEEILA